MYVNDGWGRILFGSGGTEVMDLDGANEWGGLGLRFI